MPLRTERCRTTKRRIERRLTKKSWLASERFCFDRFSHEDGRAGGIRTHDLLNPIQAHYQAVLRPDKSARCRVDLRFSRKKRLEKCNPRKAGNPQAAGCLPNLT